jgi:MFS family permease
VSDDAERAAGASTERAAGATPKARQYLLTAGSLGASAGQVLVVALLPVMLAQDGASAFMIGFVIAAEGVFALAVPYPIGKVSDAAPDAVARRIGRRNALLLVTAPVMATALVTLPLLDGYWSRAAAAFVFFAALHAYRTPLWALTVESVPERRWGSVEGVRGAFHAGGVGFGLVGGGLLFAIWPPLPFIIAAALVIATTLATFIATPADSAEREPQHERAQEAAKAHHPQGFALLRERRDVRWFLIAHSLWTAAVDGIRPFIFLFASVVLGITIAESSLVLLVLLLGLAVGSIAIGRLGDRFGRGRVLGWCALVLGVAMSGGIFIRNVPLAIAVLIPVGITAAAFVALPYAHFSALAGDGDGDANGNGVGRQTGLYNGAIGVAQIAAPLLVGGVLELGAPLFPELDGFPLMWPVVGALALASVLALRRSEAARGADDGASTPPRAADDRSGADG